MYPSISLCMQYCIVFILVTYSLGVVTYVLLAEAFTTGIKILEWQNLCLITFSPPPHPNPRTHLPHTVHVPFARTTSFQSSFFVSVCNLWNSLREEVVSLPSSRSFKAALLQLPSFSL